MDIIASSGRVLSGIANAQATAQIEVLDLQSLGFKAIEQSQHFFAGFCEGIEFRQLGANMAIQPGNSQIGKLPGRGIQGFRLIKGNPKLIFLEAGRNIRVSFRVHVGVDAEAHRCSFVHITRNPVEHFQFRPGFHIETEYPHFKRGPHFIRPLTHARKYDFLRITARFQHPLEFAARNNIKAAAEPGEQIENCQIGVGFYGIANKMVPPGKRPVEFLISGSQRCAAINITGSADFSGNTIQGN